MLALTPCPQCSRHVRSGEASCPFCSAALSTPATARRSSARSGLKRAALFALSTTSVALAAPACGEDDAEEEVEEPTNQPVYGAPAPTVTNTSAPGAGGAGNDVEPVTPGAGGADTDPDGDIGVQPLYGAPPADRSEQ
jgi:hypothetical protein